MLVLERHVNGSIIIIPTTGERIIVTVVEVRGDKCRLGITAPIETSVHRSEVQERIDREGPQKRPRNQDDRELRTGERRRP